MQTHLFFSFSHLHATHSNTYGNPIFLFGQRMSHILGTEWFKKNLRSIANPCHDLVVEFRWLLSFDHIFIAFSDEINSMFLVLSDHNISWLNSRIYENKWITFFNLYAFKPPTHPLFILKITYECLVLTSASSLGGSYCTLSFSPPFDVSRMIIWKPSVALLIVASKHKHHLEYDKFRAL